MYVWVSLCEFTWITHTGPIEDRGHQTPGTAVRSHCFSPTKNQAQVLFKRYTLALTSYNSISFGTKYLCKTMFSAFSANVWTTHSLYKPETLKHFLDEKGVSIRLSLRSQVPETEQSPLERLSSSGQAGWWGLSLKGLNRQHFRQSVSLKGRGSD